MPHKNSDVAREYRKEWKRSRRSSDPEYAKRENRKWRDVNPRGYILSRARCRAKEEGVPFTITVEDIVIPEVCPIFPHLRLEFSSGSSRPDNSPSLDRIIPALGYVPGNVKVISMFANRIKSNATSDQLRKIADWIDENTGTSGVKH